MKKLTILAFVLAGGEGTRLSPLTEKVAKPSLPVGSRYRIVDFVLSNLINSDIYAIYLLVQYKSQSLIEHIRKSWVMSAMFPQQFVTVVPPQRQKGDDWFLGTADAVYQNLNLIEQHDPDLIIVFGADHIYRMDVQQMVKYHRECGAQITVAALPVPLADASGFGVIAADTDGRIREFQEKPKNPTPMLSDPDRAYASMGNYLFDTKVLVEILEEAYKRGERDFGIHILPRLMHSHRLFAYNFATNQVPGVKAFEEKAYWRDVGTLDAYFNAHQDLLGLQPHFNLFNPLWPIYSSSYQGPGAKIFDGIIKNSVIGGGSLVQQAVLQNTIVRREVVIEKDVELEDCLIMDYVRIRHGTRLRRAIVGPYNVIDANVRVGYDPAADKQHYHVTASGITVVPPGRVNQAMRAFSQDF